MASDTSDIGPRAHHKAVRSRAGLYRAGGKRAFDIALCLFLIPAVLPVVLVLALIVRRDGGPAFFAQERIGRGGRPFRCRKLRSMVVDAEDRLAAHLANTPGAAAEWARDRKLAHDPRITRTGAFLRRASLDELPQLWNVLRGDMSLVGPRPVVRAELEKYGPFRQAYLDLRPGLTGPWQVSGRNALSYGARVRLDAGYHAGLSFRGDVALILRTGVAVIDRTGR